MSSEPQKTPSNSTPGPAQNVEHAPVPQMMPYPPFNGTYPPAQFYAYAPQPEGEAGANAPGGYLMAFTPPGMVYAYPPPPNQSYSQQPAPAIGARAKRKQVKMACTNCAAACKRCDEARPCDRCIKYSMSETCVDGERKERKKGIKRGPYKRKNKPQNTELSFQPDTEWPQAPNQAPSINPSAPPTIQTFQAHLPPPQEGAYFPYYFPPPGFVPPPPGQDSPGEGGPGPGNGSGPPLVQYYLPHPHHPGAFPGVPITHYPYPPVPPPMPPPHMIAQQQQQPQQQHQSAQQQTINPVDSSGSGTVPGNGDKEVGMSGEPGANGNGGRGNGDGGANGKKRKGVKGGDKKKGKKKSLKLEGEEGV